MRTPSAIHALGIVTLVALLVAVAEPLAAQGFGGRTSGLRPARTKAPVAKLERGPAKAVAPTTASCCEAVAIVLPLGVVDLPMPGIGLTAPVMEAGSTKLGVREEKLSDIVVDVVSSHNGASGRPNHRRARKVLTNK
jgi:hypothetical protein